MPCNSRQTGRQADRADGRRQQTADTERHREKHRAPATQVPWPVGWLACVSGLAGLGEGCECALGPRRLHVRQVPPPCRALPCLALPWLCLERERGTRALVAGYAMYVHMLCPGASLMHAREGPRRCSTTIACMRRQSQRRHSLHFRPEPGVAAGRPAPVTPCE